MSDTSRDLQTILNVIEQKGVLGVHTEFNRMFQLVFKEDAVIVNRRSLTREEERLLDPMAALLDSITDINQYRRVIALLPNHFDPPPIVIPVSDLARVYSRLGKQLPNKFNPGQQGNPSPNAHDTAQKHNREYGMFPRS